MDDAPLGLRERPFGDVADPDIFYASVGHDIVCAQLLAAVQMHWGLILLTGEPGTGKTTVLRRVTRDVEESGGRVLRCDDPAVLDLTLASFARQLDVPEATTPSARGKGSVAAEAASRVWATVVAVDEAQRLGPAALARLRELADAWTDAGRPLAVLLVGQPDLALRLAPLDRQGSAPALRLVLSPLPASEVGPYMAYRLDRAGGGVGAAFQSDAIERVAAYADGIPRAINNLCAGALRAASQADVTTVSASIVDGAARQLRVPFTRSRAAVLSHGAARQLRATGLRAAALGHRAARQLRARFSGARVAGMEQRATRPRRSLAPWRRGHSWRGRSRAWMARAGVTVLVLVTALLFALRPSPHQLPPDPPAAKPPPTTALQSSPATPFPAPVMPTPPVVVAPPSAPAAPGVARQSPDTRKRQPESRALASAQEGRASRAVSRAPWPAVDHPDSPGERALLDAVEAGELMAVRRLLDSGTSPSARDPRGLTPLMAATIRGDGAAAELLLDRGANVNARDNAGVTALMLAARNGHTALLRRLLDRGATVEARTRDGWTALTYAAWTGHPDVARRLLTAGADPALTDRSGWSPLMYASWRAAESNSADPSAVVDSLDRRDLASVEVARRRYTELVNLLTGATR